MTTFMEPATIDIPIELIEPNATCTASHDWCEGDCSDGHHASKFAAISAQRWVGKDSWADTDVWTSVYINDAYSQTEPMVSLLVDDYADEVRYSAAQARQQSAALANAADLADPLPMGVMMTAPELIHLDDELLTDDGWQKVTGVMAFTGDDTIRIFTPERDPDGGDGWELDASNLAQIRRRVHGSCAIQFVEPFPAVGGIN